MHKKARRYGIFSAAFTKAGPEIRISKMGDLHFPSRNP
tara:strand:- start:70 stop:183 length:114 start_codon:yes stop_codon:yes gene_type:complete